MKKLILLSAFFVATIYVFAQKPVKHDKGFVFGLSGVPGIHVNTNNTPTATLGLRYLASEKNTVRFGVRLGSAKSTTKSDTTGSGIDTTVVIKTSNYAFSLGWQHTLGNIPKLMPYYGMEGYIGGQDGSRDTKIEVVSAVNPTTTGDFIETIITHNAKGKKYGIRGFAGFNYFFADHFSIGAEFGYALGFLSVRNGSTSTNIHGVTFGPEGNTVSPNSASNKQKVFDADGSGVITVSVYF